MHFPPSTLIVLLVLLLSHLQAGLDKMSKGHMLADVVAIIGTRLLCRQRHWAPVWGQNLGTSCSAETQGVDSNPQSQAQRALDPGLQHFLLPGLLGTQDIVFGEVDR